MTDQQINMAIAKICGWTSIFICSQGVPRGKSPNGYYGLIPIYTNDLNEMHEVEKHLLKKQVRTYAFMLAQVLETSPTVDLDDQFKNIHAAARQRAEAFLKTLGKWEEVQE